MRVGVIGTGYVGLVVGACLAETGNHVVCADIDETKIEILRKGKSPIYEPGLEPLLQHNRSEGRLEFTTDVGDCVERSEVIFIAVGTPMGANGNPDLSFVLSAAETIGRHLNDEKVIVTKSTVPVGTTERVRAEIARHTTAPFHVCSNPEFLKEGASVEDFMRPDRIIVGVDSDKARAAMEDLYAPFVRGGNPIIVMDIPSAEMTKYAANAMLATRISFMNQIAALCEVTGADINQVRRGIGSDPRIGPDFLYAGAGYGGSCFPKDMRALVHTGESFGLDLSVPRAAEAWNQTQKEVVFRKVTAELGNDLSGKRIAVWGLAFKAGTDDVRDAVSLTVIPLLLDAGAEVAAHDPRAAEAAGGVLPKETVFARDEYEACENADALLVLTEWLQYRRPDLARIKTLMRHPLIVDGRNLFELEKMAALGFTYLSIGRSAVR
ncbi:UDP-glucose dehydrogenase family protein [Gemmatimonadota bacterium]